MAGRTGSNEPSLNDAEFTYHRFLSSKTLVKFKIILSLQTENSGSLAEWLGAGLQNRLRRFESATNLILRTFLAQCNNY